MGVQGYIYIYKQFLIYLFLEEMRYVSLHGLHFETCNKTRHWKIYVCVTFFCFQVPGYSEWYNIVYEDDRAVHTFKLLDDYRAGALRIKLTCFRYKLHIYTSDDNVPLGLSLDQNWYQRVITVVTFKSN